MSMGPGGVPKLESLTSLAAARTAWTELAEASGNVFSTWEWADVWWRHEGAGRTLLLRGYHGDDGRLAALLPLYLAASRPVRAGRFLGHGPADQLGPVCAPAERARAARAVRGILARGELELVFAELLPREEPWASELGGRVVRSEASPTAALDGWGAYLQARSANFRQQVRGRTRRLERAHDVRFRLADDPGRLDDDVGSLFRLHEARWGPGSPFLRRRAFHEEFARTALARGWLRLWLLELDGEPAAAWYGFRFAGSESYYQAGRDPSRADASVGFVLLAHSVREAAEDGVREYRLLRGDETFKRRFADADPGLVTVIASRGVRGRVAGALAAAALRSDAARSLAARVAARAG